MIMDIFPHSSHSEAAPQPQPASEVAPSSSEAPTNAQLRADAPSHIGDVFVPAATTLEEQPAAAPEATAPDLDGEAGASDTTPVTGNSETEDTPQAETEATDEEPAAQTEEVAPSETPTTAASSFESPAPAEETETEDAEDTGEAGANDTANVISLPTVEAAPEETETENAVGSTDESSYKEVFEKLKEAGADVDSMPASAFMETVEEYGAASSDVQVALTELTEAQARVQAAEARRQAVLERYTGNGVAA